MQDRSLIGAVHCCKKNPVETGVCSRTGSYEEPRATLPAGPSRHGGRPTEIAELNSSGGMPTRGPRSERRPEGRDMRPTEAEESSKREGAGHPLPCEQCLRSVRGAQRACP